MYEASALLKLNQYMKKTPRDTIAFLAREQKLPIKVAAKEVGISEYMLRKLSRKFKIYFPKRQRPIEERTKKVTTYAATFDYRGKRDSWKGHAARFNIEHQTVLYRRRKGYPLDVVFGFKEIPWANGKEECQRREALIQQGKEERMQMTFYKPDGITVIENPPL